MHKTPSVGRIARVKRGKGGKGQMRKYRGNMVLYGGEREKDEGKRRAKHKRNAPRPLYTNIIPCSRGWTLDTLLYRLTPTSFFTFSFFLTKRLYSWRRRLCFFFLLLFLLLLLLIFPNFQLQPAFIRAWCV